MLIILLFTEAVFGNEKRWSALRRRALLGYKSHPSQDHVNNLALY
jgi:hypothetical protein